MRCSAPLLLLRTVSPGSVSVRGAKRRCLSGIADDDDVANALREVMRNVAQPVAIVTARNTSSGSKSRYHGATLTSFTSLTLQPDPLVAFSLRLPSRLADCLRPPSVADPAPAPDLEAAVAGVAVLSPSPATPPTPASEAGPSRIPLTVSLLSSANEATADSLSSRIPDQSEVFSSAEWDGSDPPALRRALGALRCEVFSTIPLRDINALPGSSPASERRTSDGLYRQASGSAAGSELFICRVLDVIQGKGDEGEGPLLHLKQRYVGVRDEADRDIQLEVQDKG